MSGREPNPHEAHIGRFLRALERPVNPRPYYMAHDGSLRQKSCVRSGRRLATKLYRQKNTTEPPEPRRSWADVQAAWRRRQEAR